jgi:hypothetical protein
LTRRSRTPPGLRKANQSARDDRKNRGKPLPAEEMREEVATSFAPARKEWSGKNDGTPGCLRTRRTLRLDRIYVPPSDGCTWCGGTEFRRTTPDENWPRGRSICLRCHPTGTE